MTITIENTYAESTLTGSDTVDGQILVVLDPTGPGSKPDGESFLRVGEFVTVAKGTERTGSTHDIIEIITASGERLSSCAFRLRPLQAGDRVLVDYGAITTSKKVSVWDGPATVVELHTHLDWAVSVVTDKDQLRGNFPYAAIKQLVAPSVEEELAAWEVELLGAVTDVLIDAITEAVEEPSAPRELQVGDRVQVRNGDTVLPAGALATITERQYDDDMLNVVFDNPNQEDLNGFPVTGNGWYEYRFELVVEEVEAERQFQVGDFVSGHRSTGYIVDADYSGDRGGDVIVDWTTGTLAGRELTATKANLALVLAAGDAEVKAVEDDVYATIEDIDAFRAVNVEGAVLRSPRTGQVYVKRHGVWQTAIEGNATAFSIVNVVEAGNAFQVLFLP